MGGASMEPFARRLASHQSTTSSRFFDIAIGAAMRLITPQLSLFWGVSGRRARPPATLACCPFKEETGHRTMLQFTAPDFSHRRIQNP